MRESRANSNTQFSVVSVFHINNANLLRLFLDLAVSPNEYIQQKASTDDSSYLNLTILSVPNSIKKWRTSTTTDTYYSTVDDMYAISMTCHW
jgi:hypothetical protein